MGTSAERDEPSRCCQSVALHSPLPVESESESAGNGGFWTPRVVEGSVECLIGAEF